MLTTRYSNSCFNDKKRDVAYRRFVFDDKWTTDESGDEQVMFKHDKDRFIELAQAALEQARMEEEQKGVFQELLEVLIAQTGAPMVAETILEQFRSQDVIEKIAEDHCERRRSSTSSTGTGCDDLKEEVLVVEESNHSKSTDTMLLVSEYLWRFFRLLLLASLVCLVYHFMCVNSTLSSFV